MGEVELLCGVKEKDHVGWRGGGLCVGNEAWFLGPKVLPFFFKKMY